MSTHNRYCSIVMVACAPYQRILPYFAARRCSIFCFSAACRFFSSSFVVSYLAFTWLNGFSSLFSNSLRIFSLFWFCLRPCPLPSSSISFSLLSSNAANAALNLRSGCLSIFAAESDVRDNASRALSMPVALSAAVLELPVSSSCERSRPRVFLTACLEFLGAARAPASSSARRASFSAFLRACSAFLAASASLRTWDVSHREMDTDAPITGSRRYPLLSRAFGTLAPFFIFCCRLLCALYSCLLCCHFGLLSIASDLLAVLRRLLSWHGAGVLRWTTLRKDRWIEHPLWFVVSVEYILVSADGMIHSVHHFSCCPATTTQLAALHIGP